MAAPFGLKAGQAGGSLSGARLVAPGVYSTTAVPQPNPLFETYILRSPAGVGICKIVASGKTVENDAYGSEVRQIYGELKATLVERYGKPTDVFEFIKSGALWDSTAEWVMSLEQNERYHSAYWNLPGDAASNEVSNIELEVESLSRDSAYVSLSYELSNFEKCASMTDRANKNGL